MLTPRSSGAPTAGHQARSLYIFAGPDLASCLRRPISSSVLRHRATPHQRSTIQPMQLTTGTVVGGKIVIEGDPLPDGTVVTILARESDETFVVPPELEAELLQSIAEAERGEFVPADELLRRLRRNA